MTPDRRRLAAAVLLALLLLGVAALTLGPLPRELQTSVTRAADALTPGSPGFPDRRQVEVAANGLLLVPVGVVLALLLPRVRAVLLVLAVALAPVAVEAAQALRPDRTASLRDVVLNALGGAVGVALVRLWPRRPRRLRRLRRAGRARRGA